MWLVTALHNCLAAQMLKPENTDNPEFYGLSKITLQIILTSISPFLDSRK